MCISDWLSLITGIGTWGLVLFTWRLVYETKRHLSDQNQITKENLAASLQYKYENDFFDTPTYIRERSKLARQIISNAPYSEYQETIIGFFESVGTMVRRGYLDKELSWSAFSFFAIRWWCATKEYVYNERKRYGNDDTIFEDFQKLVDIYYEIEIEKRKKSRAQLEPSAKEIAQFLKDEQSLSS